MNETCQLKQALIQDKRQQNLSFFPLSSSQAKAIITGTDVKNLIEKLEASFEYILIDSPAGIDSGFLNAIESANEAIVIVTPEVPSIRDAEVIKTTMKMAKKINKVAVLVGVCFGFVGNRMIETYGREASRMMLEGGTPEHIDKVIYDFGLPMGPFTMGDMAGQDIGAFVRESRREFIKHDPTYCILSDKLVAQGRVGLKAGKGVYLYEAGSRKPIPDPSVLELAKEVAADLGVAQRDISDQEIIERIIFPMINEGALILDEGIAAKSSDIDVIYVYGYGFPVYRGGPMQYADEIGLKTVYDAMCKYRDELGEHGENWFEPAPLLKKLAEQGKRFADL